LNESKPEIVGWEEGGEGGGEGAAFLGEVGEGTE